MQSGGLPGGVGASLPPAEGPECPAQGYTLLFTGSWARHCRASGGKGGVYRGPAGAWSQLGRPHLCPRGWERPPLAGPPLGPRPAGGRLLGPLTCLPPRPAGGPKPQAHTSRGAPQEAPGRVGERRECSGGRNNTTKQNKSLPPAPARTPAPPYLVPGPAFRNRSLARSLGAGLRNAIER